MRRINLVLIVAAAILTVTLTARGSAAPFADLHLNTLNSRVLEPASLLVLGATLAGVAMKARRRPKRD